MKQVFMRVNGRVRSANHKVFIISLYSIFTEYNINDKVQCDPALIFSSALMQDFMELKVNFEVPTKSPMLEILCNSISMSLLFNNYSWVSMNIFPLMLF